MLKDLQPLVSLCKRRGFIFPSSEVYGGLSACWDYGPLGVQLKRNIQSLWWQAMTHRQDIEGLDSSILMHPSVWKASGHVDGFSDPLIDCKKCRFRWKPDKDNAEKCPKCGSTDLSPPRLFNLMFKTQAGPLEDKASSIYLRPETAQGIYLNFLNIQTSMRKKIPFGVAQIGKAFRNEITLGNFIFRCREFEQMEMQYFVSPENSDSFFDQWLNNRKKWLAGLGFSSSQLREKKHDKEELAHYARRAVDIEFLFPMGWRELEGIHHRGDFDLKQHQNLSGKNLSYFSAEKKESFIPHVIETSIGCDRLLLALLCSAYREETVKEEKRLVLSLSPALCPIQTAILPLNKKDTLQQETAHKIQAGLETVWRVEYDDSGSIGKRYRRQDEIGTAFCVTVDFESEKDKKATIRQRDTMKQERLPIENINSYLMDKMKIYS